MIFNGLIDSSQNMYFWKIILLTSSRGLESNKMHQGENYQDFLKLGGVFLGHSLIIIKWTWGVFFQKFGIWHPPLFPPTISTIKHKRV